MSNSEKKRHSFHSCHDVFQFKELLSEYEIPIVDLVSSYLQTQEFGLLIGGSIAEGTATAVSDLDFLVLLDSKSAIKLEHLTNKSDSLKIKTIQPGHLFEILHYINGVEINIQFMEKYELRPLIDSFISIAPALYDPRDLVSVPRLAKADLQFLHRLKTGWIIHGNDVVELWRCEFMLEVLPMYIMVNNFFIGIKELEDAEAAIGGAPGLAEYIARNCVEGGMTAVLAKHDYTSQGHRWIRYLSGDNIPPQDQELLQHGLKLLFVPILDSTQNQQKYVTDVQEFMKSVSLSLKENKFIDEANQYLRTEIQSEGLEGFR